MNYNIRIFPEHGLVIEHISGEITLEAMIEKMKNLFSNPQAAAKFIKKPILLEYLHS
jgi:hypothetical protein